VTGRPILTRDCRYCGYSETKSVSDSPTTAGMVTNSDGQVVRPATATADAALRMKLLEAGAANLRQFGYPSATADKIMGSLVFRSFFKRMLEDEENVGKSATVDRVRQALLAEIAAAGAV